MQTDATQPKDQKPDIDVDKKQTGATQPKTDEPDIDVDKKQLQTGATQPNDQKPDNDEAWRKDKQGRWLTPHALYMRFYRTTNSLETEESYEWWTYGTMVKQLGPDLASDLKQRHEAADPRRTGRFVREHPDFPGIEEQYRYKNFASGRETKRRTELHEAEISQTADVQEEDAFEAMEKLLAEQESVHTFSTGETKPKPKKDQKPKKEKTWAQLAKEAVADTKANVELTEYEGFEKSLQDAGVSENFREALMKDVEPCRHWLSGLKHDLATAVGNKVTEIEMKAKETQRAIVEFKMRATPIRDAIKKANATAKPKGKAKAKGKARK
ncbi:unnamed protein product [Symbiodinium sp. CCMP2456]|nr:unnamed protein product [Symbiodinium sp. CCMP2456]